MEGAVRLRLLFEDQVILTDHQRADGLDRCWILLQPDLHSVSDLVSHLTRSFSLQSSCPDGLLLSMDEFVLPPFESTGVFKDRDLVRVWKKDAIRRDVIEAGDNTILVKDADVVEKQPILLCDKHLATRESAKESSGNLSEEDANEEHEEPNSIDLKNSLSKMKTRKRKRLDHKKRKKICRKLSCLEIANPFHTKRCRRKKIKLKKNESHAVPFVEGSEIFHVEGKELCSLNANNSEKNLYSNGKLPDADHGSKMVTSSLINETLKDVANSKVIVNRNDCIQEKSLDDGGQPQATGESKKFPSRSARRKKAKRMWLREMADSEKKKTCSPERTGHQNNSKNQETTVDSEKEKEFVPIVVKPGHIRFELSDEDEQTKQQTQFQGTIEWNGTLDKKKGQKWGREKATTSKRTGKIVSDEEYCEDDDAEEGEVVVNPVDFEKLCPLTRLPKVGDVVAYRLVELTSSWCPEISTFRVGKLSFFDPETMHSVLVPFPGYPIPMEKGNDESEIQPDNSLYKEDYSLEIDFTSLLDVRLFKGINSEAMTAATSRIESNNEEETVNNMISISSSRANPNLDNVAPPPTGKEIVTWDEITEALNKKKAELLKKDHGSCEKMASITKDPGTKPSWSYRALRGSALGPTISLLRANNQL